MRIFIDTNSDWNGGYLAHLNGFLSSAAVHGSNHEFIVHGPPKLQNALSPLYENVNFLEDETLPMGFFRMNSWRKNKLPALLKKYNPDVHFNPMGWLASKHNICPSITMSRNLQPFIPSEVNRVPILSKERWRLILAKRAWLNSYNRAQGLIFLSDYAREIISPDIPDDIQKTVIPHGVNEYFRKKEVTGGKILQNEGRVNLLYVSRVFTYKNHDKVIWAVDLLRKKLKIDFQLILIGGVSKPARRIIDKALSSISDTSWIQFKGAIPNPDLVKYYHSADIFVFASSIENFPNILAEAMASGLPIACANRRPMKDILLGAGEYFEPNQPESIAHSIEKLTLLDDYRMNKAVEALKESQNYSFEKMSNQTIKFIELFSK